MTAGAGVPPELLRPVLIGLETRLSNMIEEPWPSASAWRGALITMRADVRAALAAASGPDAGTPCPHCHAAPCSTESAHLGPDAGTGETEPTHGYPWHVGNIAVPFEAKTRIMTDEELSATNGLAPAPASAQPAGSGGYCPVCYHPVADRAGCAVATCPGAPASGAAPEERDGELMGLIRRAQTAALHHGQGMHSGYPKDCALCHELVDLITAHVAQRERAAREAGMEAAAKVCESREAAHGLVEAANEAAKCAMAIRARRGKEEG